MITTQSGDFISCDACGKTDQIRVYTLARAGIPQHTTRWETLPPGWFHNPLMHMYACSAHCVEDASEQIL